MVEPAASAAVDEVVWLDRASRAPEGDQKWDGLPAGVLAASYAQMDVALPLPIADAIRRIADDSALGYAGPALHERLRTAFARHADRRFGWTVDVERTSILVDVMQGVAQAIAAFSAPGDRVVCLTPGYPHYLEALASDGRELAPLALERRDDEWRLPLGRLREAASRAALLILCNPHNPTGAVFDRETLDAVARIAAERDLVVVSDEIHMDLTYAPFAHVPFAPIADRAGVRSLTLASASKSVNVMGAKCAIAVATDPETKRRFETGSRFLRSTPSVVGLVATIAAWEACGPWIDRVRVALAANRDRLLSTLAAAAPDISVARPRATYLAWLDFRGYGIADPQDFFLSRARVLMFGGQHFGVGHDGFARFNFAAAPRVLDEMTDRLVRALVST